MDEKYISADELAIQLSVTGPTIRKWVSDGKLPSTAYLKIGSIYRFKLSDVVESLSPQQLELDLDDNYNGETK